jgi:hypothetical protein
MVSAQFRDAYAVEVVGAEILVFAPVPQCSM